MDQTDLVSRKSLSNLCTCSIQSISLGPEDLVRSVYITSSGSVTLEQQVDIQHVRNLIRRHR